MSNKMKQINAAIGLSIVLNNMMGINSFQTLSGEFNRNGLPYEITKTNLRTCSTTSIPFLRPLPMLMRHEKSPFLTSTSLQARIINLNQRFDNEKDDNESEEEEEEEEEEEDDDDDDDEDDLYAQRAISEFDEESSVTSLDWGSALGTLRQRVGDIEQGKSQSSTNALFRLMTIDSPNVAIGKFVKEANPEVLAAMSGAVSGLLGGLSNPTMGIDTIVKANGERVASLCFQLQMTGYMFRNAEYVVALKDLMKIKRGASVSDFKAAFDRLDTDGSGYIEAREIDALLSDVYDGSAPAFEVKAFLRFFDANKDGRISWEEFEKGLGMMSGDYNASMSTKQLPAFGMRADENDIDDDDEDDDDEDPFGEPSVSGTIEVELEDGKIIEVEAKDYIEGLKEQAQALKEALRRERGVDPASSSFGEGEISPGTILDGSKNADDPFDSDDSNSSNGGITALIASLGGDLKQLTQGISPDVMDTMKLLVDFVLEGGPNKRVGKKLDLSQDMELPGSALQQLALWQLVLGYRLREAEATGDYKRLLDN